MTTEAIAEIAAKGVAAKLTKAQRDAVLRGSIGDHSMATVRALIGKGVMYHRIDSPNGRCGPVENTPLGLAVRAHLLANPEAR